MSLGKSVCPVCLQYPHRKGCPENDEPELVGYCVDCGEPVFGGDAYTMTGEGILCAECASTRREGDGL